MSTSDSDPPPVSLTPFTAILAAAVAVLAAVAVGGVLGRAERNHPVVLAISLGLLIVGSILPLVGAGLRWDGKLTILLSAVALAAGVGLGVAGVLEAQTDGERPMATADFDSSTASLTIHVKADGLSTEQKLEVEVDALKEPSTAGGDFVQSSKLFYAFLGPNSDGDVDYSAKIVVPQTTSIVGVSAWNGVGNPRCTETGIAERDQSGCFVERLAPKS